MDDAGAGLPEADSVLCSSRGEEVVDLPLRMQAKGVLCVSGYRLC